MISLLNQFTLVGILKECRIDLFPSHIKAKFGIEIDNGHEVTVNYFINKNFHKEKYKEFIEIIPKLRPVVQGYVWNQKIEYYTLFPDNLLENSTKKLFISGNVVEKNNTVYFNGEYIKFTKLKNGLDFSFEGVVLDQHRILNVVSDSPRVFNIENNINSSEKVYKFSVSYQFDYDIIDNIVNYKQQNNNFVLNNKRSTDKTIEQKEIKNYLLEWEIINSDGV